MLNAVRINLRVFVTGQIKEFTIERKIAWVENALAIWRPTEALGRSLVRRLTGRWGRRRAREISPLRVIAAPPVQAPHLRLEFPSGLLDGGSAGASAGTASPLPAPSGSLFRATATVIGCPRSRLRSCRR
jgi:hypothetical protein